MQKRVIIDLARHEYFYKELVKYLPNLDIDENAQNSRKRRQKIDQITSLTMCGDPVWAATYVEVLICKEVKWFTRTLLGDIFNSAIKQIVANTQWMQELGIKKDWWINIPSFMYNVLCTGENFRNALKIDQVMPRVFSIGRYLYLKTLLPQTEKQIIAHNPMIAKMLLWLFVTQKYTDPNEVKRMVHMIELTFRRPQWWDEDLTDVDKAAYNAGLKKDKEIVWSLMQEYKSSEKVGHWAELFQDLPNIVELYHTRPKTRKKDNTVGKESSTKHPLGEASTTNKHWQEIATMLAHHRLWSHLAHLRRCIKAANNNLTCVLFEDKDITIDQVQETLKILYMEWGKWWVLDSLDQSKYTVLRTPIGLILCAPSIWVTEIQERLLPYLCFQPIFFRRFPVPIAAWLTEKYLCGCDRDKEIVIKTLYRLIHKTTRGQKNCILASSTEPQLFSTYMLLHKILDHFKNRESILNEFMAAFTDCENLYFIKKNKKRDKNEEVVIGIKNLPCIQRAFKSLLEIKLPHYLDREGLNILKKYNLVETKMYATEAGLLTQQQTLNLYKLCSSNDLDHEDALLLFYSIYTYGEIHFSAKLNGIDHWQTVSPFLDQYNDKVLKRLQEKPSVGTQDLHQPCIALYYALEIAEEMAHYPFRLTREEIRDKKKAFRGFLNRPKIKFDPRDFLVYHCKIPLMLTIEEKTKAAKPWFQTDMFPLSFPTICYKTKSLISHSWRDLRPFEDADPELLEFLLMK